MMEEFPSFEKALARLGDETVMLSHLDLYALSGASRAEAALFRERWAGISPAHRQRTISALVESTEANFEMDFGLLFRVCLNDQSEQVRLKAIEGLLECEEASLVDPFVRMLRQDPAEMVRAAAAISLGRFALQAELEELDDRRTKLLIDALLQTINDAKEDVDVRRRAIEALAYLGIEGVHEIIEVAYSDDDERMRASALFAMGRSCDTSWGGIVLSELDALEPEMRYEAARAAGELKLRKAAPGLIRLLEDPDREVQEGAIWALGQIGGLQAKRALEQIAESEDDVLQEAVVEALAELALGSVPLLLLSHEGKEQNPEEDLEDVEWVEDEEEWENDLEGDNDADDDEDEE
jgi:HEAT repeat protein